jgi:hypothetical protein
MAEIRSPFLRAVITADAAVCGLGGAVLALDAAVLQGPLGLSAGLLREVGYVLVVWAAVLAFLASRPALRRAAVWTLVVVNVLWAVESVAALALDWMAPTALGLGAVLVQAVGALLVADLQFMALRKRAPSLT